MARPLLRLLTAACLLLTTLSVDNCKTPSSTDPTCTECIDDYFLYDNKERNLSKGKVGSQCKTCNVDYCQSCSNVLKQSQRCASCLPPYSIVNQTNVSNASVTILHCYNLDPLYLMLKIVIGVLLSATVLLCLFFVLLNNYKRKSAQDFSQDKMDFVERKHELDDPMTSPKKHDESLEEQERRLGFAELTHYSNSPGRSDLKL